MKPLTNGLFGKTIDQTRSRVLGEGSMFEGLFGSIAVNNGRWRCITDVIFLVTLLGGHGASRLASCGPFTPRLIQIWWHNMFRRTG